VTILILTGSIKISIDPDRKDQKLAQIIVQSAGATFETVGAAFTVTRNLLTDQSSVYVEKGTVTATQYVQNQKKDRELVNANEKTTIYDRLNEVESPKEMSEKEIYFLNPKNYPNNSQISF
jgi:ferric-dicitrate binding protein FerR (iron transport regulator)